MQYIRRVKLLNNGLLEDTGYLAQRPQPMPLLIDKSLL